MAFSFPKIFKKKLKPKSKPSYSPKTEQDITLAMADLALKGPRWIGEQMGKDLDEAFETGDTKISITKFIRHPIKTTKSTLRKWTISKWKNQIRAEFVAEYVWKPRLGHFKTQGKIGTDEHDFILKNWAEKPEGFKRDEGFERLEELHKFGHLDDDVWQGIHRQHQWDEFSRFRRNPSRYAWKKVFGKRGHLGEGPLYKYGPQKIIGEPLGRKLAATSLGSALNAVKGKLANVARKVVTYSKRAIKFIGKQVAKGAKWVITKVAGQATWATISATVAAALGTTIAPGVGTVIGFLAGPVVFKAAEWIIKISCLTCGCATLMFAGSIISLLVSIFGAFRPPDTGGLGPEQLVEVVKTVSPTHLDLGADWPDTNASYTIVVTNKTDKEITGGTLVDTHNPVDFNANTLSGGDWDSATGKLTWSDITIAPNDSFSVKPKGEILDTSIDKVVINNVSFTGTLDGDSISAGGSAVVIIGSPLGQPPSGWPTAQGCVTQGPGGSYSHTGDEAVDIGKLTGDSATYKVYATHDGIAYAWTGPDGPFSSAAGKYVEVISHGGIFRTYYAHLFSHSVTSGTAVEKGTELGVMGKTGSTDGGAHVHYEVRGVYEGGVIEMKPPYIPVDVGPCSDACNCCFTTPTARCGE